MIDLHCHILPGIDDGAETLEDSVSLLDEEKRQGVSSIIFTPHFNFEKTNITDFCRAREQSLQRLKSDSRFQDTNITVKTGAEVYFSVRMLEEDIMPLCFTDSKYILIELPVFSKPYGLEKTIDYLIGQGYMPILAHIERYPYFSENINMIYNLVMRGCLAQVNAGAIIRNTSSLAVKYIKWEMAHIVCSDCHSIISRPPNLQSAFYLIEKKLGKTYKDWLIKNSNDIFNNKYVDIPIVKKPHKFLGKWI